MLHVINIGFERVNVKFFRSLDKNALRKYDIHIYSKAKTNVVVWYLKK